jgi:hypothetical protein
MSGNEATTYTPEMSVGRTARDERKHSQRQHPSAACQLPRVMYGVKRQQKREKERAVNAVRADAMNPAFF